MVSLMSELSTEVKDRDIVVSKPGDGLSITYRKEGYSPVLFATDPLRGTWNREKAEFMAQAWKVAYAKAKMMGWL